MSNEQKYQNIVTKRSVLAMAKTVVQNAQAVVDRLQREIDALERNFPEKNIDHGEQ